MPMSRADQEFKGLRSALAEAFVAELMQFFSDPRVTGAVLLEHEAWLISNGALLRVDPILRASMSRNTQSA